MLRAVLLLAFVCSGGAGLVYELVWSRYLTLFVGHSAEAQVLVIGMFLGGMSAGALAVAERSQRLSNPLRAYALVEVALAGVGLGFHVAFRAVTDLSYDVLFPALGSGVAVLVVKWAIASALVFLPSLLLGATFPLMAAGVLRAFPGRPGGVIAGLYFANSLGGAIAILVAGFVLLSAFGLPGTSASGAALNLLAAAGAMTASLRLGSTRGPESARTGAGGEEPVSDAPREPGRLWRLLLAVSGLTAVASFIYEIGWIRMLSLVMGSATHSFELMLSAFIFGLAVGALVVRGRADRTRRPLALLGWIQWAMGLCALATLPLYVVSFDWMAELVARLPSTDAGYRTFNLARYGVALAVMFPATAFAGMTLPVITATLLRAGAGERAIGWVYAVNTAGAIAGVMLAGLVLMPLVGLKGMLIAGATLDIGLGILLLASRLSVDSRGAREDERTPGAPARTRRWLVAAGVSLAAVTLAALGLRFDRALLTSGVFRYGPVDWESQPILYYADGRTASIGVHVEGPDTLVVLTSNGKPDASLTARWIRAAREPVEPRPIQRQDESTQMLAALVTVMHAEGGRAAVIGHGSGVSSHFVLADPRIESLVTIEIEPRVVDASYVYHPANARVFEDPRSTITIADAKSYFAGSGERYDLILSEPSNPWVSGTASLFSREFYARIRAYLTPTGVFGQWFHFYEMSDELVTTVLAALHESFLDYRAYLVGDSDLLIVATGGPELPTPDWALLDDPDLRAELAHVPPIRPHHMEGLRVFQRDDLEPLLGGSADANSDYRPILDLGAERTRFLGSYAAGLDGLATDPFRVAAALGGWRLPPAPEPGVPVLGLAPLVDRSRAARVRGVGSASERLATPAVAPPPGAAPTIDRLGLRTPPAEADDAGWRAWTEAFGAAAARRHAGSAGFVDAGFFEVVRASLIDVESPPAAAEVVSFVEALFGWEFERAARSVEALLEDGSASGWLAALPPELSFDGSVVAALKAGDPDLAERAWGRFLAATGRREGDFRLALLRAYLERAGGQGGGAIRSSTTGVAIGSGRSVGTSP